MSPFTRLRNIGRRFKQRHQKPVSYASQETPRDGDEDKDEDREEYEQREDQEDQPDPGQHQPNQTGPFTNVPFDIIFCIASYLRIVDIYSLALCCRPFYTMLSESDRAPRLNRKNLETFPQLLEKDDNSLYFCHACLKLHKWEAVFECKDDEYLGERSWRGPRSSRCIYTYGFQPNYTLHYTLTYAHARIVMNRHLYGPAHGPPPSALDYEYVARSHGLSHDDIRMHITYSSRIISDELFRLTRYNIRQEHGNSSKLRECIDFSYFKICEHVSMYPRRWGLHIPQLARPQNQALFTPCESAVGSCPTCLTDYEITISDGSELGWCVEILVYQQFGSCRSPFRMKWRSIAEDSMFNQPRCKKVVPGEARHLWIAGDEDMADSKYSFVGRPTCERGRVKGPRRCPWGHSEELNKSKRHDCATYHLEVWPENGRIQNMSGRH
ncbi:hypothetical protein PT974_04506 [Cladobotryum mycophilum]|uniref:F-box domain-containing protein n=1 Tax=Cladobotryum mycophilum TaxID=491253 RepID=A0ABR0SVP3_9HYPO